MWGNDWPSKSGIDLDKIKWQPADAAKKRPAVKTQADLLNFTDFSQLAAMIIDHWNDFKDAFPDRVLVETYIKKLKPLRNAVSHTRPITPFERDLVSGMSGEIINLITKYRSSKGGDMEYWPIITVARDSFGFDDTEIGTASGGYQIVTNYELKPGERVQFHFEASDPEDRELTWQANIERHTSGIIRDIGNATGETAGFEWIVAESEIGQMVAFAVKMTSSASHHRHGTLDDRRIFWYRVVPRR